MIDQRRALMRQLQEMLFHAHLVGIFRWDQGEIGKPKEVFRKPGEQREAGKYQDQITMRLPGFTIEVIGPSEDPRYPCGLARVTHGQRSIDGPLDAMTWLRIGNFIKENRQEDENGDQAAGYAPTGGDWGR